MRITSHIPSAARMSLLFVAALAAGCSHGSAKSASVEQNLGYIGLAYDRVSKKAGRTPRSTDDLKSELQRFGDPEAILLSPRDGQPFVIRWGVTVFRPGPKGSLPILAYEATGVDGKKYVLDNMLGVRQMTQADLDQALRANK